MRMEHRIEFALAVLGILLVLPPGNLIVVVLTRRFERFWGSTTGKRRARRIRKLEQLLIEIERTGAVSRTEFDLASLITAGITAVIFFVASAAIDLVAAISITAGEVRAGRAFPFFSLGQLLLAVVICSVAGASCHLYLLQKTFKMYNRTPKGKTLIEDELTKLLSLPS